VRTAAALSIIKPASASTFTLCVGFQYGPANISGQQRGYQEHGAERRIDSKQ